MSCLRRLYPYSPRVNDYRHQIPPGIMKEILAAGIPFAELKEPGSGPIRRWQIASAASFATGMLLGLGGLLLSMLTALNIVPANRANQRFEVMAIIAALLLLVLGAHCLDRINEIKKV
ncbi:MAG: hypothetical protein WKF34_08070 [Pyrinomonadaceae bacterium]